MRKSLIIFVSLCALMIAAVAASAATNFAGTWELDKSKSQLTCRMANIDSLTWTITQTDKDLTIESQASGGGNQMPAQKTTYSLDGK